MSTWPAKEAEETPQALFARAEGRQRTAWQQGRPERVEQILDAVPGLRGHPERVLDLILHEVHHREEHGERPELAEYQARFPALAGPLVELFAVHRARPLDTTSAVERPPDVTGSLAHKGSANWAESTLTPGTVVGGHEVLEVLGKGGMGVVYKARHLALGRLVALKVIRGGGDEEERIRFRREAEAVARLAHPHIVPIYEVGEQAGLPFFSMEYVEGGTLARRLRGTPLPADQAAALVQLLARAMHHAHGAGIIHRDLKPANVLLQRKPTTDYTDNTDKKKHNSSSSVPSVVSVVDLLPKIADFGLAKRLDQPGLTASAALVGTPSYMAPEQAAGKPREVGPAADVYALGAVLYECLTGRPPFTGATALDTALQVLHDDPIPPRRLNPRVPADLETVCLKCLHKEPARRYASAADLADDLTRFLRGEPIHARPVGSAERAWKWARRHPAGAALAVVSVLAGAALLVLGLVFDARLARDLRQINSLRDDVTQAAAAAQARRDEAEQAFYRAQISAAWQAYQRAEMPEARAALAACPPARRRWEWDLLQRLCRADRRRFQTDSAAVRCLTFSRDGRRLVTGNARGEVHVRDLPGGRLQRWRGHRSPVTDVALSPDGRTLASASLRSDWFVALLRARNSDVLERIGGEVILWDVESGKRREALEGYGNVALSPDGRYLAWVGPDHAIHVRDEAERKVRPLPVKGPVLNALALGPGGLLAWSKVRIRLEEAVPHFRSEVGVWDLAASKPLWSAERPGDEVSGLCFDPSGTRLALAGMSRRAAVLDARTGREVASLIGHADSVLAVAFSPDGNLLATAGKDRTIRLWEPGSGSERGVLRGHDSLIGAVAFDPTRRGADWGLASADHAGVVRLWDRAGLGYTALRGHRALVRHVAVSRDGRRVASASADGTVKVWDARTGTLLRSLACQAERVAFSPDGRTLATGEGNALTPGEPGRVRLWPVETTGPARTLYTDKRHPVLGVAFSPDGKTLAVVSGNVARPPVQAGKTVLLRVADGTVVGTCTADLDVAASVAYRGDGRLLAVGGWNGRVALFAAEGGKPLRTLGEKGNGRAVWAVAFSPSGLLAAGGTGGQVALWESESGRLVRTVRVPEGAVFAVSFSADGERLAAASLSAVSGRGHVQLYDVRSGAEVLALPGMFSAAFSADGSCLAAPWAVNVAAPAEVRVWPAWQQK
jgi:WD40 repeat protein/predicted Ser/Thr protein kinase